MTDAYHGTRGYTADNASKDAAEADAASGKTNELQDELCIYAKVCGSDGVTVHEARLASGEHHGRVSSALTKLHIAGRLVALRARRGNAGIYVHPDYVNGRETRPYRRQNQPLTVDEIADVLQAHHPKLDYTAMRAPGSVRCACGEASIASRAMHERHVAEAIAAALRGES